MANIGPIYKNRYRNKMETRKKCVKCNKKTKYGLPVFGIKHKYLYSFVCNDCFINLKTSV